MRKLYKISYDYSLPKLLSSNGCFNQHKCIVFLITGKKNHIKAAEIKYRDVEIFFLK